MSFCKPGNIDERVHIPDNNPFATVFWGNMNRTHKDLQLGKLAALGMTAAMCLLWTIPMSFFASLSNASSVQTDFKWIEAIFKEYPLLVPITEQIAPFLVVFAHMFLPSILGAISLFEGPISRGMIQGKIRKR